MSRAPRVSLAALAAGAMIAGPLAVPASAAVVEVQILGINDFHGRLLPDRGIPGAAKLAGVIEQARASHPDSTVFVSAGDNVGASTFISSSQEDAPTIEALNLMGLQAGAVGNHEFDRGYDWLADPASHGIDGEGLAQWPSLGANVGGSELSPSAVVTTATGVQVGLVGVVTEQTPSLVASEGIAGLTFTDPVTAANAEATRLKDGDLADVVVLLAHEGTEDTTCATIATSGPLGEIVSGANDDVDAILSGHTHARYACTVDGVPVVQTGQYGSGLDRLVLTVDTTTNEVTAATAEVVDVLASTATPDPEVAALVAEAKAVSDEIGQVPVGEIAEDITRARNADGSENRGAESTLGNFIADVQLQATQDLPQPPVIAFMNPGGLRADLLYAAGGEEGDGVVTYAEASLVQPFANTLNTVTLTGAEIKAVLEQQWQPSGASTPFLHLGVSEGFRYTYDPAAPAGSRILTMTLEDAQGVPQPIDPLASYRVAANSFLATGGDNFTAFRDGENRLDTGKNDLEELIAYFEAEELVFPDTEERAIRAGQYDDDTITSFSVEAPAEIGPGEVKTATVTITTSAAMEDELFSLALGLGVRIVGSPEGCEVLDDFVGLSECVFDGLPQGTTTIELDIAGESLGTEQTGLVAAYLDSPVFDDNPIEEPYTAETEITVLDGELNGKQSDLDEDGIVDLLARSSLGQLLLYSGDGSGTFGRAALVGSGFTGQVLLPGDLSGDGIDDVLHLLNGSLIRSDGRGDGTLSRRGTVIGTGFRAGWTLTAPGDFDGDGIADVLGRNAAGQLALFPGTASGGLGRGQVVGTGWGVFTAIVAPGDLDGDGAVDLLGRTSANALYLYRGNGEGGFTGRGRLVGTGWSFSQIVGLGDVDSDLVPDVLGITRTGDLYLYPGNGAGGFLGGAQIGRGWSSLQLLG